MSEDRKQPTAGFWIIVALLAVLVGYPLSFGPACWLCEKQFAPAPVVWIIFRPLTWLVVQSPDGIGAPIRKYAAIFSERDDVGLRRRSGMRGLYSLSLSRPFKPDSPIDCEMRVSSLLR